MKNYISILFLAGTVTANAQYIHPIKLNDVKVKDSFWSPRLRQWSSTTVYDVLDKLEGKYTPDREDLIKEKEKLGHTRNAFNNFDLVAKKMKGISDGPPWYDGLVYETIRGAADILIAYPDPALEKKIDAYIQRIAAAQAADPDGYINTYTTLNSPDKRWGLNGGDDRWQHDVYNAGMLAEAGVHYYKATGKTALLDVAVKMCNYMASVMGAAPKFNIIPAHAGPEEALLKLYLLSGKDDYYTLVKYWIERRGVFADPDGSRKRSSYGSYDQDHIPVFEQKTIEGHAVRATLLGTGIAAMALYNHDARYITTADNYWNNMVGKRMFITGGEGAIAQDEKFGDDYFLPESAYLETCAAVGAGFFSQRMNELKADGKYMDELERVLYNNILSGISLDGKHYHYENPLIATDHKRWEWHSCPCCPPMFLKMAGILPSFIYAQDSNNIYVNLFIGSEAKIALKNQVVTLTQQTQYPFKGNAAITINPSHTAAFGVKVRIPGWAVNKENPFDLYTSSVKGKVSLKVNGQPVTVTPVKGYATINRTWKKGDVITLDLPVQRRLVYPSPNIKTIENKVAVAAGPLVYAVEKNDTIPFFEVGNRGVFPYKVWLAK